MAPRWTLAIVVSALAMFVSCLAAGSGCPCGESFDRDPFGGDSLDIGADHEESVHCFCRCGTGPRERLPPSATCEEYEGPCQTDHGEVTAYVCE